ncbi:MAG: ribbon-helix-helix protein, CopG family [Xanthomonadales bacterium]|nr:ribbon-helix-helix protein, CopG family [Xanthomonadales bacterium]
MKTITLKADAQFDAELTALAHRLSTTKSAVIREAVGEYIAQLDQEELRQKLLAASLKVRQSNLEEMEIWDTAIADGLDDLPE